jgi:hypothetical protein
LCCLAWRGGSPPRRRPRAGCAGGCCRLLIRPSRVLPPLECCRGVSPSEAARCRPEVN